MQVHVKASFKKSRKERGGSLGFVVVTRFHIVEGVKRKKITSQISFKKSPNLKKNKNNSEENTIVSFHVMNASAEQSWKPAMQGLVG